MSLPGVTVTPQTSPPPRSAPTDTGVAFLVGLFAEGKVDEAITEDDALLSLADFAAALGGRQSWSLDYDWADTFFREGGNRIYPVRVVGPDAEVASSNLAGTGGATLVVSAKSPGSWGNSIKRQVTNGSDNTTRIVKILDANDNVLEQSPQFSDELDAVDWSESSDYVVITKGVGTGLPTVAAAAALTGGDDDRAGITNTEVIAAMARFGRDLGPGQIVAPGWTTDTIHEALLAHAASHNRFAVCDAADTTSKSALITQADGLRGDADGSYGMLLAPWLTIPGTSSGSAGRQVPASALFCARAAVIDASDGPNQAPAGDFGRARYATGVTASFSRIADADGVNDAEDLNDAGVNLVIVRYGSVEVYGNRTLVDPDGEEANLLQASNARYRMSLVARGEQLGEPYVFRRITSHTIAEFRKDLVALLNRDYINGDLFGDLDDDRPETAFNVDTDSVNTQQTAQDRQLNAALAYRPSPGAEMVSITITATALTEPVA